MADEEVQGPDPGRPPGWYPAGNSPNEQVHWDGQRWTARRRWVHSAWVDVPLEAEEARPPSREHRHRRRWGAPAVILLVLALAGLGGLVFALANGVNSAPAAKSTAPTTSAGGPTTSAGGPTTVVAPATPTTPTTSSSAPTTTSTTSGVSFQPASEAQVAACQSDAKSVEVALAAYQAQQGHYPAPPSPWSATTYANDYLPLTSASGGGPYLPGAPTTTHYVVEYDASGHVWITPPGAYDSYDPGQDFDTSPNVCLAAVG